MKANRKTIAAAVMALALAAPAPVFAAEASIDGYGEDSTVLQNIDEGDPKGTPDSNPASTPTAATDAGGKLPFTGLDLGLLGVAGGALMALGLGMRRLTRSIDLA